jgi:hypothetical protein
MVSDAAKARYSVEQSVTSFPLMRRAKPKLIVAGVAIGIVITSAVLCTYGGSKNVSKSPFYCRQCQSNEVDAPTGAKVSDWVVD